MVSRGYWEIARPGYRRGVRRTCFTWLLTVWVPMTSCCAMRPLVAPVAMSASTSSSRPVSSRSSSADRSVTAGGAYRETPSAVVRSRVESSISVEASSSSTASTDLIACNTSARWSCSRASSTARSKTWAKADGEEPEEVAI